VGKVLPFFMLTMVMPSDYRPVTESFSDWLIPAALKREWTAAYWGPLRGVEVCAAVSAIVLILSRLDHGELYGEVQCLRTETETL
jgi:hypothetical protein